MSSSKKVTEFVDLVSLSDDDGNFSDDFMEDLVPRLLTPVKNEPKAHPTPHVVFSAVEEKSVSTSVRRSIMARSSGPFVDVMKSGPKSGPKTAKEALREDILSQVGSTRLEDTIADLSKRNGIPDKETRDSPSPKPQNAPDAWKRKPDVASLSEPKRPAKQHCAPSNSTPPSPVAKQRIAPMLIGPVKTFGHPKPQEPPKQPEIADVGEWTNVFLKKKAKTKTQTTVQVQDFEAPKPVEHPKTQEPPKQPETADVKEWIDIFLKKRTKTRTTVQEFEASKPVEDPPTPKPAEKPKKETPDRAGVVQSALKSLTLVKNLYFWDCPKGRNLESHLIWSFFDFVPKNEVRPSPESLMWSAYAGLLDGETSLIARSSILGLAGSIREKNLLDAIYYGLRVVIINHMRKKDTRSPANPDKEKSLRYFPEFANVIPNDEIYTPWGIFWAVMFHNTFFQKGADQDLVKQKKALAVATLAIYKETQIKLFDKFRFAARAIVLHCRFPKSLDRYLRNDLEKPELQEQGQILYDCWKETSSKAKEHAKEQFFMTDTDFEITIQRYYKANITEEGLQAEKQEYDQKKAQEAAEEEKKEKNRLDKEAKAAAKKKAQQEKDQAVIDAAGEKVINVKKARKISKIDPLAGWPVVDVPEDTFTKAVIDKKLSAGEGPHLWYPTNVYIGMIFMGPWKDQTDGDLTRFIVCTEILKKMGATYILMPDGNVYKTVDGIYLGFPECHAKKNAREIRGTKKNDEALPVIDLRSAGIYTGKDLTKGLPTDDPQVIPQGLIYDLVCAYAVGLSVTVDSIREAVITEDSSPVYVILTAQKSSKNHGENGLVELLLGGKIPSDLRHLILIAAKYNNDELATNIKKAISMLEEGGDCAIIASRYKRKPFSNKISLKLKVVSKKLENIDAAVTASTEIVEKEKSKPRKKTSNDEESDQENEYIADDWLVVTSDALSGHDLMIEDEDPEFAT